MSRKLWLVSSVEAADFSEAFLNRGSAAPLGGSVAPLGVLGPPVEKRFCVRERYINGLVVDQLSLKPEALKNNGTAQRKTR